MPEMFATIQYHVPRDFQMGAVRVIDSYVTDRGHAAVESWDTPEGRIFYALDENGELLAPATERKSTAILTARRHVRWHDHLVSLRNRR